MMRGTDGFTLVEVLVAFVIMSLAVITGMRVFADGVRRLAIVEERLDAIAAARLAIDTANTGQPLPGTSVEWTALQPHAVRVAINGQTLETIVLLPGPQ